MLGLRNAMGATFDPCADPARLAHLNAFGERHEARENTENYFELHTQWVDGKLAPLVPGGSPIAFRFVRTDDSFRFQGLVTHYFTDYMLDEDRKELRATSVGSEVLPIHRVYGDSTGDIRLTKYLFVRGLEPVSHPLSGTLALLWDQLLHGKRPVSLFLVAGTASPADAAALEERADAWLAEAWSDYRGACRS